MMCLASVTQDSYQTTVEASNDDDLNTNKDKNHVHTCAMFKEVPLENIILLN